MTVIYSGGTWKGVGILIEEKVPRCQLGYWSASDDMILCI